MKRIILSTLLLIITIVYSFQILGNNFRNEFNSTELSIKQVQRSLDFTKATSSKEIDHSAWDVLLNKYVDQDGFVDYKGFLNDRDKLTEYLHYLFSNIPNNDWSIQELLAYYINLYNAQTIDLILENYPLESIKDLNRPWSQILIKLAEEKYSLGDIEHKVLRKMNEPRIHFAINCASYSCPNILNEAFKASIIEEQLEKVTLNFINSSKNEISTNNPKLSKIFKWYKKDFVVEGKEDLIGFINQYSTIKIDSEADIDYKDYNWELNEQH